MEKQTNQNQKPPIGLIILILIAIVSGGIIAYATDSIMIGMGLGAGIAILLAILAAVLKNWWGKVNHKKVILFGSVILGAAVIVTASLLIANASIPSLTTDEAQALVAQQLQPYADTLAQELGLPGLTVAEVEMEQDTYYRKPSLFKKGYISVNIDTIYLQADAFPELEKGTCNEDICNKYDYKTTEVFSEVDEWDIVLDRHEVNLYSIDSYTNFKFVDAEDNEYAAKYGLVTKNGETVFDEYAGSRNTSSGSSSKGSSSSSKGSKGKCSYCGGSGKRLVTWYSEGDWGETSYTSYDCPYC